MRPRLFLAMGSAIVLLLIIQSANGGGCGGAVQGQGLGRGRDPSPFAEAVPARWRTTKDHRRGDRAGDHQQPGKPAEHHHDAAAGFRLRGPD